MRGGYIMEILVSPVNSCNDDVATADFCSPVCTTFNLCIIDLPDAASN